MRLVTGLLAAVLLLAGVGASHAVVRIGEDRGGRIGTYVDKYQDLRSSGETVIIDGLCASACTIVLGAVPHDKICVTSHANLGFHAAWDFGANGRAVTNPEATQMLYSMYPSAVKRWISARGGLTPAHDLPARQATDQHVQALLHGRASVGSGPGGPGAFASAQRDRARNQGACPLSQPALSEDSRSASGNQAASSIAVRMVEWLSLSPARGKCPSPPSRRGGSPRRSWRSR